MPALRTAKQRTASAKRRAEAAPPDSQPARKQVSFRPSQGKAIGNRGTAAARGGAAGGEDSAGAGAASEDEAGGVGAGAGGAEEEGEQRDDGEGEDPPE